MIAGGLPSAANSLHFLEKLPMPGLEQLRIRDLIELRANEEQFALWRDELIQIYALAKREQEYIVQHPEEFTIDVAARVRARRSEIIQGIERRGVLQSLKQNAWTLGMGMVGLVSAEVVIPGGTLTTQLLGAFIGGGSPILAEYLGHKLGAPQRDALVRVYSVFDAASKTKTR